MQHVIARYLLHGGFTYCMVVLLIAWWFYLLQGGFTYCMVVLWEIVGLVCLSMVQTGYGMPTRGISFILLVLHTHW